LPSWLRPNLNHCDSQVQILGAIPINISDTHLIFHVPKLSGIVLGPQPSYNNKAQTIRHEYEMTIHQFRANPAMGLNMLIRKITSFALSLILMLGPWGCASKRGELPVPPSYYQFGTITGLPSEETRSKLGRIGVTNRLFSFAGDAVDTPLGESRMTRAGKEAGSGALGSLYGGLSTADPVGLALGIALAPVMTIWGGISGAIKAVPEEKVSKMESQLHRAMLESAMKKSETIRDQIFQRIIKETGFPAVLVDEQDISPSTIESAYAHLNDSGIDTLIEVSIKSVTMTIVKKHKEPNPQLDLSIEVSVALIRLKDDKIIYKRSVTEISEPRGFTEWSDNEAEGVRKEMELFNRQFPETVVDEIFFLYR